jgi:hypothetical protein
MNRSRIYLLAFAVALCAAPVLAGPLATEPNAYVNGFGTWHGSTNYQGYDDFPTNTPGHETQLIGHIDWVVFAPNVFNTLGYAGYVAPAGEYVYAYQATETGSAPLSNVSVTLETLADTIGTFTGNGVAGGAPSASYFFPNPLPDPSNTSANWDFAPGVNATTSGLIFSSPFGPKLLDGSTIDDGSIAVVIPLPSPEAGNIPEPGTLTLASCGLAVFGLQWLRRRVRRVVG